MSIVEEIHESVAAEIGRVISCHAQAQIDGTKVSYHPCLIGIGFTHTLSTGKKSDPSVSSD